MGRNVDGAREARIALLREEGVLDELQLDRATKERRRGQPEQAHQQVRPPAERARRGMTCVAGPHGGTITMSLAGGMVMCSFLPATLSTNA